MINYCALPTPLPLGEGVWPDSARLDSFSLREKMAEGRMRVKCRMFFRAQFE